jgi:beta-lactamase regulating signal transducer with metallopeptidase domain
MDADVQNLANWSQIIALVIAVIALVLQVIIWRYPSQASAQSVFRYARWVLLLVFVASSFFLLGSRFTSSSSTQGGRSEAIAVSSASEQKTLQPSLDDETPEKTPTPTEHQLLPKHQVPHRLMTQP